LIAARSFLVLFIADALISLLVALILFRFLQETKPVSRGETRQSESLLKTVSGYQIVLRDLAYMIFTLAVMTCLLVYQQQYSSLSVYLRDVHNIGSQDYGVMLSIAGLEVVLLQIWISRSIKKYPPFLTMALGTLFFLVGFTMIGFVHGILLFMLCIILITIGEMITFPTNRVIVANFAPPEMRGRYMAVFDLSWTLPATVGPAAAGVILDYYQPNLVWYLGGILCTISVILYYALHLWLGRQERFAPAPAESQSPNGNTELA